MKLIFTLISCFFSMVATAQTTTATKPVNSVEPTKLVLSIGGGITQPSNSTKENTNLDRLSQMNVGAYVPLLHFGGATGGVINVGVNVAGEYFAGNKDYNTGSFAGYNIVGQTNNPTISAKGSGSPKQPGFKTEAGVQANFQLGAFTISPILNVGYFMLTQKAFAVVQNSQVNGQSRDFSLYSQSESKTSGAAFIPKMQLRYKFGRDNKFSIYTEVNYVMGPTIKTATSIFSPNGSPVRDDQYNLDQMVTGTQNVKNTSTKFSALGVNIGVSFHWFSKKGYDSYKAHSDMGSYNSNNNPSYKSKDSSKMPAPASNQPQNQSIINTTKSNTKDRAVADTTSGATTMNPLFEERILAGSGGNNPETSQPQNQSIVNTTKSNTKDRATVDTKNPLYEGNNGAQTNPLYNAKMQAASDSSQPQNQSIINTTKSNTKDRAMAGSGGNNPETNQPQNQSIVNTTKSNTKDRTAVETKNPLYEGNNGGQTNPLYNSKMQAASDSSQPQNQSIINTTKSNTKDRAMAGSGGNNPETNQPQNQSIVNTTKSNTKDRAAAGSERNNPESNQPQNQSIVNTTKSNTKDRVVAGSEGNNPESNQPQNQSIVNTTKSNTKDRKVAGSGGNNPESSQPQNQSIINTTKSNTKDRTVTGSGGKNPESNQSQNQSIINTTKSNTKDRAAVDTKNPLYEGNNGAQTNPLYNAKMQAASDSSQPQNQSIINTTKSNTKDRVVADTTSPLYEAPGNAGHNPLFEGKPGSSIKGIIVKGGKNPGGNMITLVSNANGEIEFTATEAGNYKFVLSNPVATSQSRPGNPIGGLIIKGGKNPPVKNFSIVSNDKGEIEMNALEAGNYKFTILQPNR